MDQALTATRAQDLNPDTARRWLDEWNRQQEGYVRFRDCRFEIIADALNASGLVAPVILDLGCGPGSLGDRLAARLPGAEIVGLDYDPVLLTLARVLHADDPDRSWIELDMRRHDWVDYLEGRQFDNRRHHDRRFIPPNCPGKLNLYSVPGLPGAWRGDA